MKVVAINGSGRKDGNTYLLLKTVLDELKDKGSKPKSFNWPTGRRSRGACPAINAWNEKI